MQLEYTVSNGMKQIPIKWTAPEALNYGTLKAHNSTFAQFPNMIYRSLHLIMRCMEFWNIDVGNIHIGKHSLLWNVQRKGTRTH